MSNVARTVFYREFGSAVFGKSRYLAFAAFFSVSAALFGTAIQIGEGKFWTLQALWTLSVALPLPILVSIITMPLFAGERSSGTYESLAMLPIPLGKVVAGKFIASYLSVCVAIAGSLVPWLFLSRTLKGGTPPISSLAGAITMLLIHAFSWTALGTLSTALARRPWLAAVGTLISGISLMLAWAACSRFWLGGNWLSASFPTMGELLDAAGGHIHLHTVVFHVAFGLWCLFAASQSLEASRK